MHRRHPFVRHKAGCYTRNVHSHDLWGSHRLITRCSESYTVVNCDGRAQARESLCANQPGTPDLPSEALTV
ncbi:MAG TPA: hypothetical protein PKY01_20565, partial [Candidatus Hydrogenedentes bacterium]|nr:hypothetical protein [Candidatus Hydrogenedentota bacterium]